MSRQPDIDPVVRATIPFGLHLLGPALSKLLDDASNELERDNDAARRCLARASAMLKQSFAPSDRHTGSTQLPEYQLFLRGVPAQLWCVGFQISRAHARGAS
jgi:hypothetical protein